MQLILTDDALVSLSKNPDIMREFPFMGLVATPKAQPVYRRSCCNKSAAVRSAMQEQFNRVKTALDAMPADKKTRFKALTKADQVFMFVKTGTGVARRVF